MEVYCEPCLLRLGLKRVLKLSTETREGCSKTAEEDGGEEEKWRERERDSEVERE